MDTFSAEAVERLHGPGWLADRRQAAYGRFEAGALPSAEEELWRYSRIAELDLDRYRPAEQPVDDLDALPAPLAAALEAAGPRSALVVLRDGHLHSVELSAEASEAGVEVGLLAELDAGGDALGAVVGAPDDALGHLHDALAPAPVLVRIPRRVVVPHPIVVASWTGQAGAASFPHVVVQAGEDSEATVYGHSASADVDALVVPVVELDVGPAARLRWLDAQLLGPSVWQLGRQASRVGRDADLTTTTVALGGDYARLRIDSSLTGRGGSGEMLAVYFGEAGQMHDVRTLQDHIAPSTTSDLLFKGAVQGRSHAVYSGLIRIGKEASGVDARQTNRNITLSEGAWAESVPNLEIENNDVRCAHASAVGPVDEEQRFYLESRGVPPERAERLIVLGFFEEVLERLPVPGAAASLRAEVTRKLARREAQEAAA